MVDLNRNHHQTPIAAEAAQAFGRAWADSWSRGDIEAVLAHFAEDCVFESPIAEGHVGTTRLFGKAALRAYWQKAVAAIGTLRFTVDFVAIAPARRAITIVYRAELGDRKLHACERLIWNDAGQVVSGMGLYGPPVLAD